MFIFWFYPASRRRLTIAGLTSVIHRLQRLRNFNPYGAGTVFRRHNLTFNVDPRTERIKKL